MLDGPKIVAVYPAELRDMRLPGVPHPVTVEHSLTTCDRCGKDAWIGPKQKLIVTFNGYEKVCYVCIAQQDGDVTMQSANLSIDDAQRRFT